MTKLSISEETIELLPTRETLAWSFHWGSNVALVLASNSSTAANLGSVFAIANSTAVQNIGVSQH
ncbi:hypothetical protein [Sinomonas cyclohexanicum]|nr:hypothetical protein [Corynebacterium cyclohexanicum]